MSQACMDWMKWYKFVQIVCVCWSWFLWSVAVPLDPLTPTPSFRWLKHEACGHHLLLLKHATTHISCCWSTPIYRQYSELFSLLFVFSDVCSFGPYSLKWMLVHLVLMHPNDCYREHDVWNAILDCLNLLEPFYQMTY